MPNLELKIIKKKIGHHQPSNLIVAHCGVELSWRVQFHQVSVADDTSDCASVGVLEVPESNSVAVACVVRRQRTTNCASCIVNLLTGDQRDDAELEVERHFHNLGQFPLLTRFCPLTSTLVLGSTDAGGQQLKQNTPGNALGCPVVEANLHLAILHIIHEG